MSNSFLPVGQCPSEDNIFMGGPFLAQQGHEHGSGKYIGPSRPISFCCALKTLGEIMQ